MKIVGVATVYYPLYEDLERNIKSYLNDLDCLILWDNTPEQDSQLSLLIKKFSNSKIIVRSTGENEYLASPFNKCIFWAKEQGYTHILTMDQDSYFENGCFKDFLHKVDDNSDKNIALFTPSISTNVMKSDGVDKLKFAYTSGTIIPLAIFDKVGLFREDLAIYAIDVEYSFRVRKCGYSIIRFNNIVLNHQMGYAVKNKLGFTINNYSAVSTYYIIRNTLVLWKEYPTEFSKKDKLFFVKYKIVYRILKLIFERNKLKKTKSILLGLIHGFTKKTGLLDMN